MRKRSVALGAAGLVILAVVAIAGAQWMVPTHRINLKGYESIEPEMSEAEVTKLLGKPPGWYAEGHEVKVNMPEMYKHRKEYKRTEMIVDKVYRWVSDEGSITVCYNSNREMVLTDYESHEIPPRSFLEIIRRCMHI